MGESKKYVVYGMMAKCSEGTMENYISTDTGHGVVYQGQPVLNANDHQKGVNLTHFGDCNSRKIYEEAKKEIDEKYKAEEGDGFFTKLGKGIVKAHMKTAIFVQEHLMFHKCELDTPLPWIFTSKDHMIDGAPALTMESQCACRYGGIITIVQEEAETAELVAEETDKEFEKLKEELIQTVKNEPWDVGKIYGLLTDMWNTDTGNKMEEDFFKFVSPIVSPAFAFEYVKEGDYYRTNETYGVQRNAGFMDFYDNLGYEIGGMDLDTEILVFTPKGSDKEYRLQFWKGSYMDGNAYGGEIGLYSRSVEEAKRFPYTDENFLKEFIRYDCVSGKDEIRMIQIVYTDTETIVNDTGIYAKNGDHYWNLAVQTDKGYSSEDIVTKNILYIEDENMRNAIIEEIKKNDNLKLLEDEMEWNTVVIEYGVD